MIALSARWGRPQSVVERFSLPEKTVVLCSVQQSGLADELMGLCSRAEGSAVCLAQPNGLGTRNQWRAEGQRPGHLPRSLPHLSFVDLDVVCLAHASVFVLKRHLPVMFGLIADVIIDRGQQRVTDGKRPVPGLPGKDRSTTFVFLRPFRCLGLHLRWPYGLIGIHLTQPFRLG